MAAWCAGFLTPVLVGSSSGGFFPTAWGWTAVCAFWLAATVLVVVPRFHLRPAELVYLALLCAFTAWTAASVIWSVSVPSTMHEVQRNLAYVGALVAAALLVRAQDARAVVGALCTGLACLCLYGLLTRLLPVQFGTFNSTAFDYRLSTPITYWNGLGIVGVVALLLALGFATRGASVLVRALAAGSIPLLATTVYFTFSRGALYAAAVGFLVAVAVDRRRLQLLVASILLAPWVALAVELAHRRRALVTIGSTIEAAQHDGRGLLPLLVAVAVGSGLTAGAIWLYERKVTTPPLLRAAAVAAVGAIVAGSIVVFFARVGTPTHAARSVWRSFEGNPSNRGANGDVSSRLLSLSSNGRVSMWRVSLHRFEAHPVVGTGAGTFWQAWARHRDFKSQTNQAHSLYLGALGELGLVGLALLGASLLVPLAVSLVRGSSSLSAAAGAYGAWLVHAGIDWDWALVGVSLPGLLCGLLVLKGAGVGGYGDGLRRWVRVAAVVSCLALSGFCAVVLVSDIDVSRGAARAQVNPAAALVDARHARRLAPWSSEPYVVTAAAYAREGEKAQAAAAIRSAIRRDPSSWMLWRLLSTYGDSAARAEARARLAVLNPLGSHDACIRCGLDP